MSKKKDLNKWRERVFDILRKAEEIDNWDPEETDPLINRDWPSKHKRALQLLSEAGNNLSMIITLAQGMSELTKYYSEKEIEEQVHKMREEGSL